ncbi:MAG: exodeoxyribonuclease VII small subunit [Streptosporangiaceae bacterium]
MTPADQTPRATGQRATPTRSSRNASGRDTAAGDSTAAEATGRAAAGPAQPAGEPGQPGSRAQAGAGRPPYEQARDELAELVKRLEAGGLTLEQSLALWERGEQLAAICEDWLEGARARLAAATALPARDEPGGRGEPGSGQNGGKAAGRNGGGGAEPGAPF